MDNNCSAAAAAVAPPPATAEDTRRRPSRLLLLLLLGVQMLRGWDAGSGRNRHGEPHGDGCGQCASTDAVSDVLALADESSTLTHVLITSRSGVDAYN